MKTDSDPFAVIGNISQWGEVKKKTKDRARSKVKEPAPSTEITGASTRGGRGRGGFEGHRGGRGRGTERVRGAGRGSRGGVSTNGTRASFFDKGNTESNHEPTVDSTTVDGATTMDTHATTGDSMENSWDQPLQPSTASPDASSWEMVTPAEIQHVEAQKPSSKPDGTRSWASIFNKPISSPSRPKVSPAVPAPERVPEASVVPEVDKTAADKHGLPPPEESISDLPSTPPTEDLPASEPAVNITPSKDELTETNLEQVLDDTAAPPPTGTAASTVASTHDPRSVAGSATPAQAQQSLPAMRPGLSGYATSAYKAAVGPGRTTSFQRRVLEQQEAVVMPGNHAVDRAAVQFGRMGLGDTSEDLDVDDDREDAETRTQPPQHSPVAPRATLPPAPQQPPMEATPTPRQAPGLPPLSQPPSASQQPFAQQPTHSPGNDQGLPLQSTQSIHSYNQFNNRYAPPSTQPEMPAPAQKAYEPFGQQFQQSQQSSNQQHQYDGYPSHSQAQQQPGQQSHAGYSSAAQDYSSLYTSDNQRNAYQNFYENYAQPTQQNQQEASNGQQKTTSGFGSTSAEQPSQYATSQGQQVPQVRYNSAGETQNSGHSTPNPSLTGQQGHNHVQQPHHMAQQHAQGQAGGQHGAYPYGHPYYNNNPYYSTYMNQVSHHHSYGRDRPMFDDARRYDDHYLTHNQFGYGGNQGGYGGGPYGGKQGMYGQPHQGYGMSPQSSYEHQSASPANVGGYGQQHSIPGRDGALGSGLGSYGRTGSSQAPDGQSQQSGNSGAFGNMSDVFSRSQSSFTGQSQGMSQQQSGQGGSEEASRGYGDSSKIPGGPSPAAGQPSGRPGSAVNNMQSQSGLPSQNQSQQGYSGYPNQMGHQMHGQQNSQYGAGLGALGSHHQGGAQSHQGGAYGGGYGAGFGGSYYGNNNRGGWGGNYGH